MSKKLQCQQCGKAEYNEDLYNYNGETLCRYCIVSKLCETSSNCEYIGICDDKEYSNRTQNLQHQLDQQKAMWNELKLWILDTLKQKRNSPKYYKLNDVLDKINELEKDYKNE